METGSEESPNERLCSCECCSFCMIANVAVIPLRVFVCGYLKFVFQFIKVIKDVV